MTLSLFNKPPVFLFGRAVGRPRHPLNALAVAHYDFVSVVLDQLLALETLQRLSDSGRLTPSISERNSCVSGSVLSPVRS